MGLCDLYDYKLPKGMESWQGKDRDRGRPPAVNTPTLPPTLTLNATREQEVLKPAPEHQARGRKPHCWSDPSSPEFWMWRYRCFNLISSHTWEHVGNFCVVERFHQTMTESEQL